MAVELLPLGEVGRDPKIPKNDSDYKKWLSKLTEGDRCIVQMFQPKDPAPLGNPSECWLYWDAKFWGSRVNYDNDVHPLKENGKLCYWNSDAPWGKCFTARIVPFSRSYLPREGQRFRAFDIPVYEPKWYGDRNFVICRYRKGFRRNISQIRNHLKEKSTFYRYKTNDGELFVIFGLADSVKAQIESCNAEFLFSESLRFVR